MPGGGGQGSTYSRSTTWTVPEPGRIVAGGGHLHGGGKSIVLSEPDCGDREVFTSRPLYGLESHPFYHVNPALHEPGPINMTGFTSQAGIPVTKGQRLALRVPIIAAPGVDIDPSQMDIHVYFYDKVGTDRIEPTKKYFINMGSVGQPRDGNWRAAYCIYDMENTLVEQLRVKYDLAVAQKKIIKAGLPRLLAERLAIGR